jgi:hypothetical protein
MMYIKENEKGRLMCNTREGLYSREVLSCSLYPCYIANISIIPGVVLRLPTQAVRFLPCFVCYAGWVLTTGGSGRGQKGLTCKATQPKGFQDNTGMVRIVVGNQVSFDS